MPKNTIFRAIIEDVRYFEDTNQTRTVIKITHANPDGGLDPGTSAESAKVWKLAKPIFASFRLPGKDALEVHARAYTADPLAHQELNCGRGGVICFEAIAVGEGKAQWYGEPMRVLIGLLNETICFQARRKRVELAFAGTKEVSLEFEGAEPILPSEDEMFEALGQEVMQGAEAAPIEGTVELVELETEPVAQPEEVLV